MKKVGTWEVKKGTMIFLGNRPFANNERTLDNEKSFSFRKWSHTNLWVFGTHSFSYCINKKTVTFKITFLFLLIYYRNRSCCDGLQCRHWADLYQQYWGSCQAAEHACSSIHFTKVCSFISQFIFFLFCFLFCLFVCLVRWFFYPVYPSSSRCCIRYWC